MRSTPAIESPMTTTTVPPNLSRSPRFSKRRPPITDAIAPRAVNTMANPSTNKTPAPTALDRSVGAWIDSPATPLTYDR